MVLSFQISSTEQSYICTECKDILVQFHVFKKSVKNYKDFNENIKICAILLELEDNLKKLESQDDVKIVKHSSSEILIAPQPRQESYKSYLTQQRSEQHYPDISAQTSNNEPMPKRPQTEDHTTISPKVETLELKTEITELSLEIKTLAIAPANSSSHTPRWNTNLNLTEEQKLWILEDAKKSAVQTADKVSWKCSQCGSQMKSVSVLRKHLRDVHIVNPTKQKRERKRGKDFMEEVRLSQDFEELEDGTKELFWTCKHCGNILKSESGFIKHLLYTHVKNSCIDPSVIAKCKINIEYDDDRPSEPGWRCTECEKLYRTSTGIRNHFKLEHPDIDLGGEKYQRKIEEASRLSSFLKAEEEQSEIILETESGHRKIWQCHRCQEPRYFRSKRAFKAHVRHLHLIIQNLDKEKIEKCKIVSNEGGVQQKLWRCPVCTKTTKTRDGLVSHVTQDHPGEFDDENCDEVEAAPCRMNTESSSDDLTLQKLAELVAKDQRGALKVHGYKLSCDDCGLFFRKHYPTHVDAHKTFKHLAPSYRNPKCEECHVIFCSKEAMLKHLELHVEDAGILQIFPSKGLALYGGKKFKEPVGSASADDAIDENMFWKCGHCSAAFWEEHECVEHQLMMHVGTLVCPIDHLTFSGSRGLASYCSHMKNKHPELFPDLKFPCTYCEKEFHSIFEKLSHMKTCGAKNLECDGCGKKFFSKIKLAHHLKIEKGLLTYACSTCGKKCTSSMDLRIHEIGSHSDSRLYQCTFEGCGKSFKSSASRSSHMETHSNVTLKCTFCKSVFKKRVVLARHIKLMHNDAYR